MRRRASGFSLPELMVSLACGLLLLAAFLMVLQHCRREFAASDSLAALQDGARQALSVLVPDLEHAGYLGHAADAPRRVMRGGAVLAADAALEQPTADQAVSAVGGLPAGLHDCGVNFALDLGMPVQGSNNSFGMGAQATDCAPAATAGGARAGADTLTVRFASRETRAPRAGRLQIYSRRLASHESVELFADGRAPGAIGEDADVRDVEVRSYYLANDSVERRGWPALRVKALTESRGAAQFRDEEVLPGVEDLQVEFGALDPSDPEGMIRFVAPDSAALRDRRVIAVRLWLRLRADRTEAGYLDARSMHYAGVDFTPTPAEARQRRVLIERTVALRNVHAP